MITEKWKVSKDGYSVETETGKEVCVCRSVSVETKDLPTTLPEERAALIAAAPETKKQRDELLAALVDLRSKFEDYKAGKINLRLSDWHGVCVDAIAAATGKGE